MSLRPLEGQSPIHTTQARRSTQKLEARRRLLRCEVFNPSENIGGFGKDRGKMVALGNMRCAITQSTKTTELAPDSDTSASVIEYEIALPASARVDPASRIFVPVKYPFWEPNHDYEAGQFVVSTNWINGKTVAFRALYSARSGPIEPDWPMRLRSRIDDGAALWVGTYLATIYEVIAVNTNESNLTETVVRVKEING